jgi:hypothetical protein
VWGPEAELSDRKLLVAVSAAHLAVAKLSMKLALARRLPFDLPLLHGDPHRVLRDSVLMGTALSEPVLMMVAETAAIVILARRASPRARVVLGWLGACNVSGYLLERHVRARLRPSGWNRVETPLVGMGLALAAEMTRLARPLARSVPES